MKECEACDGFGLIEENDPDDPGGYIGLECDECGGTGQIEVED